MFETKKSFNIVLAMFVLAGIVSWILYFKDYTQHDTVDIKNFPKTIGSWTSEELTITDREFEILETRNAFTRKYTNPMGESVYLFVIYSQTNRKVVHPPEICFSGGGATLSSQGKKNIPIPNPPIVISANKLLVEEGNYSQWMYYWFKIGNTFTSNYWRGQTMIAFRKLLGKPASGALVRLTAVIDPNSPETSASRIEEFTRLITPELLNYLP